MKVYAIAVLLTVIFAVEARGSSIQIDQIVSLWGGAGSYIETGDLAGMQQGSITGDGLIAVFGYRVTADSVESLINGAILSAILLPVPGDASIGMSLCFEGTFDGSSAFSGGTCSSGNRTTMQLSIGSVPQSELYGYAGYGDAFLASLQPRTTSLTFEPVTTLGVWLFVYTVIDPITWDLYIAQLRAAGIPRPSFGPGSLSSQQLFSQVPRPVPEPGTLLLFGSGIASVVWRRRRRQGKAESDI
jgi:hypothetical protein